MCACDSCEVLYLRLLSRVRCACESAVWPGPASDVYVVVGSSVSSTVEYTPLKIFAPYLPNVVARRNHPVPSSFIFRACNFWHRAHF